MRQGFGQKLKIRIWFVGLKWQDADRGRASLCARRACLPESDTSQKAKTFSMNGAHQPLFAPSITDGGTHGADAAVDCGVGDGPTIPDAFDDLVTCRQPIAVGDQQQKQLVDLPFQRHSRAVGSSQLNPIRIQFESVKTQ